MTQLFCRPSWNLNYIADQHFLGSQNLFQYLQIAPGGRQRRLFQGRVAQDGEDPSTLAILEHFLHHFILNDHINEEVTGRHLTFWMVNLQVSRAAHRVPNAVIGGDSTIGESWPSPAPTLSDEDSVFLLECLLCARHVPQSLR